MNREAINWSGRLSGLFIDSRLTPLLVLAMLLFGLVGLVFTPREENPSIVVPAAEVRIPFPGAMPAEVEHLLLAPLEGELMAIDGVKNVYGTAHDGLAQVMVEFEVGQNREKSLVRLYDRVLGYPMPPGAGPATVHSIDVDDVPVFTVTLASDRFDDFQLRRMAERVLDRLRSVQGVGRGYVVGGREREVRIETTPERLQGFGLTWGHVALALQTVDLSMPLTARVYDGENRSFRLAARITNADQVAKIAVGHHNGGIVRIQDVAEIIDGPPTEHNTFTRFAFGSADPRFGQDTDTEMAAVTVAMAKRRGTNAVELTRQLRQRISSMGEGFLPPGVHVVVTRDDGAKADRAVAGLVEHLGIAIGAVGVVLWIFLGGRAALMVAVTIPMVFAVVMGMDLLAGPTLNRITLYALILALGMLVDDAIVVAENTHRRYLVLGPQAGVQEKAESAILAVHEIGNPTALATFTVVAVFLSLILVSGMLGEYFLPIAFNVPVSMVASLIIAYTVTPWLACRFLKTGRHGNDAAASRLQSIYRAGMTHLLNNRSSRYWLYGTVLLLLVFSFLQPGWQFIRSQGVAGAVSPLGVPLAFLPKDNKNTFLVHIHLPETTPLEITDRAAREVGELLRRTPLVQDYQIHAGYPAVIDFNGQLKGSGGNVGPQFAEIRVNLTDKGKRNLTSIDLVRQLRQPIGEIARRYPGGIIQLVEDPPGPPVRATVLAELYGPDLELLRGTAKEIVHAFRNTWDMAEVWASIPFEMKEYRLSIRRDRMAMAGITPEQVSRSLQGFLVGETLTYLRPEGERLPVPVRFLVPRAQRVNPDLLERGFVIAPSGRSIPLSELTEVTMDHVPIPILHKNGERVVYVGGELAASAPVQAVLDLDRRLDGLRLSEEEHLVTGNLRFIAVRPNAMEGYQLLWDGELRLTLDAFRDMGLALGLALISVFLLLVAYYRSFSIPLLAMSVVPLAFIGVFPGHWLLGQSFSAASMVGVIALAGVVVRNSLLIIDFIRAYRKEGYDLDESVVEAGAIRLRPILLTTLAIALGTAIMVPDPVFGGLAIALIFGSMSSALLGVVIVPLLYHFWHAR